MWWHVGNVPMRLGTLQTCHHILLQPLMSNEWGEASVLSAFLITFHSALITLFPPRGEGRNKGPPGGPSSTPGARTEAAQPNSREPDNLEERSSRIRSPPWDLSRSDPHVAGQRCSAQ